MEIVDFMFYDAFEKKVLQAQLRLNDEKYKIVYRTVPLSNAHKKFA